MFVYAWFAKRLLGVLGVAVARARDTLSRLPFVLIAIQIWFASFHVLWEYVPAVGLNSPPECIVRPEPRV